MKLFLSRRSLSAFCVAVLLAGLPWPAGKPADNAQPKAGTLWVYVGTYTGGSSKGIYRFEIDQASGQLSSPVLAGKSVNPSFLAIHPSGRYLYAVNEVDNFGQGIKSGAISAFAIDQKTGELTLLNQQMSMGADPCHVIVDRQGKNVLAANYNGGNARVVPIETDGRLASSGFTVQHTGKGPNIRRQEKPHAHSINLDAANRFAFVADLGIDQIRIYKYHADKGTLEGNDPPAVHLPPGSGPRHFAFHPDGRHAYAINELASTLTAFDYDAQAGALSIIQTLSTLPTDFKVGNSTADIHVHPSGKFLYGSNRDQGNSIAIFAIDAQTGKLTPAGHQSYKVKTPRNFNIDPTGNYMLVANQGSGSIVEFRIDQQTGALTPTGNEVTVPVPVCVQFMAKPRP